MSTFYASFNDPRKAAAMLDELLRGGVRPEDLSMIRPGENATGTDPSIRLKSGARSSDATAFVGRADDPNGPANAPGGLSTFTTTEMSRLSPVDTSNSDTNVDSVDQMEDSQEEMERMMSPHDGISYGAHEKDDVALTVLTGFPTTVPELDTILDTEDRRQDQLTSELETISIPGFGHVMGSGPLATAALDIGAGEAGNKALMAFFIDEGLPTEDAQKLVESFRNGATVLGILITPGEVREEAIEDMAARYQSKTTALYDAPRFYEGGGTASVR